MQDKRDIHNRAHQYACACANINNDASIPDRSRTLILRFLDDCALGKTVLHRKKKRIGPGRLIKYALDLSCVARWLNKPLDKAEMQDMEMLIRGLDTDQFRKRDGRPYASTTKLDFKKAIRKFYKWLLGNNREYPSLVSWFDTCEEPLEIPALTREEINRLVDGTGRLRDKAIIMTLFDSGARIEEFLNLKIKDITVLDDYARLRIRISKTKPRTITLPLGVRWLRQWLDNHPNKNDSEAYAFPMSYCSIRMMLGRLGKRVLNKRVVPHLLRHSSATYYAPRLNWAQLCYRYGWSLSSDMPQRYIDREGLPEQDTLHIIKQQESNDAQAQITALREELARLKADHGAVQEREATVNQLLAPLVRKPDALAELARLVDAWRRKESELPE
jgi:site-specific recombinase XerD